MAPEESKIKSQTRCFDFLSDVAVSRKGGQWARCDRRSSQVAELLDSLMARRHSERESEDAGVLVNSKIRKHI